LTVASLRKSCRAISWFERPRDDERQHLELARSQRLDLGTIAVSALAGLSGKAAANHVAVVGGTGSNAGLGQHDLVGNPTRRIVRRHPWTLPTRLDNRSSAAGRQPW
jgi:hypothetical protein